MTLEKSRRLHSFDVLGGHFSKGHAKVPQRHIGTEQEKDMSTVQPSQGLSTRVESDLKRQAQSGQWREIGISAVAAAAQQASEKRLTETSGNSEPRRVVTLRDIDFLAA